MHTLSHCECFKELFRSDRFIEAGIPGVDRIFGEIRCRLYLIRNFYAILFKGFEQAGMIWVCGLS